MTEDLDRLIAALEQMVGIIESERPNDIFMIANDGLALVRSRIQNTGIDSDGKPLESYSTTGVPAYLLYNKSKPSGDKIGDQYKKIDDEYGPYVSYEELREFYGLPTDKTVLTFTGEMWKDIRIEVESNEKYVSIAVMEARSQESLDKANFNAARYGNFMALSEREQEIVLQSAFRRRTKILNNLGLI